MKKGKRITMAIPEKPDFSRRVVLTPGFLATAASWMLTPEELARRVCDSFERDNPPGSPVLFILDKPTASTQPRAEGKGGQPA